MLSLSLTPVGGARLIAPDLARGFMLLLIALANVVTWVEMGRGSDDPVTAADRGWLLLRTTFIDGRSYPLFAFLMGFGLATMSRPQSGQGAAAMVAATRTIRRRGLWLLAFGAVHAALFFGDVLGSYGLLMLIAASMVAARSRVALTILAWLTGAFAVVAGTVNGFLAEASTTMGGTGFAWQSARTTFLNVAVWLLITVASAAISMMLPALVVGVVAADRGWLDGSPHRRSRLGWLTLAGLGSGALAGLPLGLVKAGWLPHQWWMEGLNTVGGPASAAGWVALFGWLATFGSTADTTKAGPLLALGRRSLTGYLAQSVIFAAIFAAIDAADGSAGITPTVGASIAAGVWLVTLVAAQLLDWAGQPGPADQGLRWLVRRSARPRLAPPMT